MPGRMIYRIPVTIERVENKTEIVSQSKNPTGSTNTHYRDLGWFAVIGDVSIHISDEDPHIKPGTKAELQLVVPTD